MEQIEVEVDSATDGRARQRARTRAALVEAARELIEQGLAPSVSEAAEHALVSQATAYRYFSSQEELLAEAAMAPLVSALETAVEEAEGFDDPERALDHFVSTVLSQIAEREPAFRMLYSHSLQAPATRGLDDEVRRGVGRGGRRPAWLRLVLAPVRDELEPETFDRLINAVTAAIGVEALSALRDVCGLPRQEAEHTMRWSALALLRQARGQDT